MVSESFDLTIADSSASRPVSHNTYQLRKNLFWFILALIMAIFVVLLVLTIYFGVNQKRMTNEQLPLTPSTLSTVTKPPYETTTVPSLPVERVPNNLKQEVYRLTISPNITGETFTGQSPLSSLTALLQLSLPRLGTLLYSFTCLETTDEIVLHLKDLFLVNSTIRIVNSTTSPLPTMNTWTYDSYSELIKLKFASSFIPPHTYTLHLTYSANISRELHGLYISKYVDINGADKTFMTSQMEPTHARAMFPCIDEPARKAIFYISVIHDASERVWSNGEIDRSEPLRDGKILSHFTPTLNMSTFLLALIVAPRADFDCRPDRLVGPTKIRSRVCGRVEILPQLAYADEIASKSLELFNDYFNITYPLPKIEHFAVPDFGAGAMENFGRRTTRRRTPVARRPNSF